MEGCEEEVCTEVVVWGKCVQRWLCGGSYIKEGVRRKLVWRKLYKGGCVEKACVEVEVVVRVWL